MRWMLGGILVLSALTIPVMLPGPDRGAQPNIVLISVDTLRPDHLPCYGYDRATAPNICRVANDSILFEHTFSQGTWTDPSMASLFLSQYRIKHRFPPAPPTNRPRRLPTDAKTLPEVLQDAGYATAAFTGGAGPQQTFPPATDFDRGFDTYRTGAWTFPELLPDAATWLEEQGDAPFFLFLHDDDGTSLFEQAPPDSRFLDRNYSGVLTGYRLGYSCDTCIIRNVTRQNGSYSIDTGDGHVPLTATDMERIVSRYDAGIHAVDRAIGKFINRMQDQGVYQNTLIIITADHGTDLGSHVKPPFGSVLGHAPPYDHTIHVPLIMKIPNQQQARVQANVELIDIFPTLIDLINHPAGSELQQQVQGMSLLPVIHGAAGEGERYVFSGNPDTIRSDTWKFVAVNRSRAHHQLQGIAQSDVSTLRNRSILFNLATDPGEQHNVIDRYPRKAEELRDRLQTWRDTYGKD